MENGAGILISRFEVVQLWCVQTTLDEGCIYTQEGAAGALGRNSP